MNRQPLYVGVCTVLLLGCVAGRQYRLQGNEPGHDAVDWKATCMARGFSAYALLPAPVCRFEEPADPMLAELKSVFISEGVPVELVLLAELESGMDAAARSRMGAVGLFQLMAGTAGRFGLDLVGCDERIRPAQSARAAARYLKVLYARFHTWPLAIAAYNAGEARVSAVLQSCNAHSYGEIAHALPAETRSYVPRALALTGCREGALVATLPPPRG